MRATKSKNVRQCTGVVIRKSLVGTSLGVGGQAVILALRELPHRPSLLGPFCKI